MMNRTVSKATLRRYPIYLKALRKLQSNNQNKVMSSELAKMTDIESTTIRRDFSFIGSLGKQGYGYNVDRLIEVFSDRLGVNFTERIIIVGMGNMGRALSNYNRWNHVVGEIACGFDINYDKIQATNIPVYPLDELEARIPQGCRIAILTASQDIQETVDRLVACGIKGIVDFTHQYISVPKGVQIKYVDVVSMIQEIVFDTNQQTYNVE
jgi:redox-sensing transcriptional repressor